MKKYQIIYADPPWKYNKVGCWDYRGINTTVYNRMELEDIMELPVDKISDKDALLFLWVTTPFLKKGIAVMEAWGFTYRTVAFTWIKTYRDGKVITGMGFYTRNATELCLLGKKLKGIFWRRDAKVPQVVHSPIGRHSEKPSEVRDRIVRLCGDLPRIELFARHKVDGWDCWGNEVESDIDL